MEKLLINDIPLSDLGAVLAPDSYKSVLTWAKFKSLQSNDWAEYNYTEYDLSSPKLDKRTVTLNFHANGADGYKRFMEYLLQYVYSYYEFPELGVTLRMRIDSNSIKDIDGKWQSFSINFFDDEPYRQQSAVVRFQNFRDTGYELDNVDLAQYGISILKGSYQSFVQIPQLKERLTISENSMDGAIYDHGGDIKFKQRSFTLKCLLRAETLQYAVANYYYIYELLRQSGARKIMYKNLRCNCFYNSCNVTAVHSKMSSGNAGIVFDVTFNVVDFAKDYDRRVEYLESDGNQWINTEYKPNTNTRTVVRCCFNSFIGSKANYVFGVFKRPNNYGFNIGVTRQFFNVPWGSSDGIKLTGLIPQTNEDYEFDISKTGYKVNGTSYETPSTDLVNSNRNMYLFWSNGTTAVGMNGRVYYCKIYNGNTLVRDLIPVRKNDIGYMYDRVSCRLFGNSGTGNFILGNDIND